MTPAHPVLLMSQALDAGGSERQLTEIARFLDRSHFQPHVACLRPGGMRVAELHAAGVPVLCLPIPSFRSLSALKAVGVMDRYIREHGIRLIHTFDPPANFFGVPAARFLRVPIVLSSQRSFRSLRDSRRRTIMRFTDELADGVVVNCRAVGESLVREDRLPLSRIHLCYNGVDLERFQPSIRPLEPGASVTVGYVGVFRKEKNLETLIEAAARLFPVAPQLRLRIVGSGPEAESLLNRSAASALNGICRFDPFTPRVEDVLREIDIFVLPSLSEACSNSLMEAMASGCAVVASRVGGNPELVDHGETGLLFEPANPDALAAVLYQLVSDAPLRRRLGDAAATEMRRRFGMLRAAATIGNIYDFFLRGL